MLIKESQAVSRRKQLKSPDYHEELKEPVLMAKKLRNGDYLQYFKYYKYRRADG